MSQQDVTIQKLQGRGDTKNWNTNLFRFREPARCCQITEQCYRDSRISGHDIIHDLLIDLRIIRRMLQTIDEEVSNT